MTTGELLSLLPLLILTFGSAVLLWAIAFRRNHALAFALTGGTFLAAFVGLLGPLHEGARTVTPLLVLDSSSVFFTGLVLVAAFFVCLQSYPYFRGSEDPEEYYLLLLTATIGAVTLAASTHFASFFLGLEILSVSLYALISYARESSRGIEASIKYLVLAGTSSAILLFGMALIYSASGTMAFSLLAQRIPEGSVQSYVGAALILVGVGFKLALVPFHLWAPDVYEGAPTPVTAYIATVSKGAVFAVFLRFVAESHARFGGSNLPTLIAILAVLSMCIGNWLALLQKNLKRLLAYSSTVHLGYLLVPLLAGATLGPEAIAFYFAAYFATTLAAFGVVAGVSDWSWEADSLEAYRGLYWRHPWLGAVLSLSLLSLAGIPLTGGFTGKFFLVSAGVHASLWGLVIRLVLNSGIALYYYLRVIVTMASSVEPGPCLRLKTPVSLLSAGALGALALAILWLGVAPSPLLGAIHAAFSGFFPSG